MEKNGNRDMTLDAQLDREVGRLFDGAPADDGRIRFAVPDAHNVLMRGLRYFLGDKAVWLPEYDKVAEWLAGNDGKGLLLYGNCGRGKTLIVSTNLRRKKSVGEPSIEERYGIRTLDRLRLLTRSVAFVGESMRR